MSWKANVLFSMVTTREHRDQPSDCARSDAPALERRAWADVMEGECLVLHGHDAGAS